MNIAQLAISITAVDASARTFERIGKSVTDLMRDIKKLNDEGKRFEAFQKGIGKTGEWALWGAGAFGAALGIPQQIGRLVASQDAFNQVKILTGKTADEMKAFKSQIHGIAGETGIGFERNCDGDKI